MKKIVKIVLAIALALSLSLLASCGKNKNPEEPAGDEGTSGGSQGVEGPIIPYE